MLRGGVFSVDGAERMYQEGSVDLSLEPANVEYEGNNLLI